MPDLGYFRFNFTKKVLNDIYCYKMIDIDVLVQKNPEIGSRDDWYY